MEIERKRALQAKHQARQKAEWDEFLANRSEEVKELHKLETKLEMKFRLAYGEEAKAIKREYMTVVARLQELTPLEARYGRQYSRPKADYIVDKGSEYAVHEYKVNTRLTAWLR